jgi:hypothetical protein
LDFSPLSNGVELATAAVPQWKLVSSLLQEGKEQQPDKWQTKPIIAFIAAAGRFLGD